MASDDLSLVCRVLARLCALPLTHVRETMRPMPIEPLAGVSRPVRGVAVIRGTPTPVVDLAWLLAGEESSPTRFVTVETGGRAVALSVDAVLGVRAIPSDLVVDLPPLLRGADTEAVTAIGVLDTEILLMLRSSRLIPETVWQEIERGRATE